MSRVSVPAHILTYNAISIRSRLIWMYMHMASTRQSDNSDVREAWVPQKDLAASLSCSKSTIARSMRQLREHGLIVDTKRRHSHFRIYELHETPVYTERTSTIKKRVTPRKPKVEVKVESVQPLNLVHVKAREQTEIFMADFGKHWQGIYLSLDGEDGRPTVEQVVYEALLVPNWQTRARCILDWVQVVLETYNARYPFLAFTQPYRPPHERGI